MEHSLNCYLESAILPRHGRGDVMHAQLILIGSISILISSLVPIIRVIGKAMQPSRTRSFALNFYNIHYYPDEVGRIGQDLFRSVVEFGTFPNPEREQYFGEWEDLLAKESAEIANLAAKLRSEDSVINFFSEAGSRRLLSSVRNDDDGA